MFIQEPRTATNMTRSHGRAPQGERLRMGFPYGHPKTATLVAGLRMAGLIAPMVLDGPINGEWFEACVGRVLVPELMRDDIVIMDNLSSHKRALERDLIEAAGATLLFLPPYNLDSIQIEKAFARLKSMLRKAAERTVSGPGEPSAPTNSAHAATTYTHQNRLQGQSFSCKCVVGAASLFASRLLIRRGGVLR